MAWLLVCSICIALADGALIIASPAVIIPSAGKAKALNPATNEKVINVVMIQASLALLPI